MDTTIAMPTLDLRGDKPSGGTTTDRPSFTRLISTVKTCVNVGIGPLNLVVGPNRAGKTGVLSAVQLALTGQHPIGHRASDLAELCAPGQAALIAQLESRGPAGGITALFMVDNCNTDSPKLQEPSPLHSDALRSLISPNSIPMLSLRDLLMHGAEKARASLMIRFGRLDTMPTPRALDEDQFNLWMEIVGEITKKESTLDPASIMAELIKRLDSAQRMASRDVNRLRKLLEATPEATAGAEQIPALEAQLIEARLAENQEPALARLGDAETRRGQLAGRAVAWRADHDALVVEKTQDRAAGLGRAVAEAGTVRAAVASEVAPLVEARDRAVYAEAFTRKAIAASATESPFCGNHAPDFATQLPIIAALVTARIEAERTVAASAQIAEATVRHAEELLRGYVADLIRRERDLMSQQVQLRELIGENDREIEALTAITATASTYAGPPSHKVEERLAFLRAAESARLEIERDAKEERRLTSRSTNAAACKKEAMRLRKKALKDTEEHAVDAVNRYMPAGFMASLRLTDTECRWAAVANGQARRVYAMCKSEEAVLGLALSLAWSENSVFRVVLLDDDYLAMLEPANLRTVLDRLSEIQSQGLVNQVFCAWPSARIDHRADIPPGWNVIDVGAAQ